MGAREEVRKDSQEKKDRRRDDVPPAIERPYPELIDVFNSINENLTAIRDSVAAFPRPPGLGYHHVVTIPSPTSPTDLRGIEPPLEYYPKREQIHLRLKRNADISVLNDGPGNIFVLVSSDGIKWLKDEIKIAPGGMTRIFDVNDMFLRTDVSNTKYTAIEYDISDRRIRGEISQIDNLKIAIDDASFESALLVTHWDYSGDGTVYIESDEDYVNAGNYSARIEVGAGGYVDLWNKRKIGIRPRRTVQTSAYLMQDGNVDKVYFLIRYLTADGNLLTTNIAVDAIDKSFSPAVTFTQYIRETYAPPGATFFQVGVRVYADAGAAAICWVDDFSLPTYPPAVPQFYYDVQDIFPQYIPPNTAVPLHVSDYGIIGRLIVLELELSYRQCYIILEVDAEQQVFAIEALIDAGLTNPQTSGIWISEVDDVNERYTINMTPGDDEMFAYNYRIAMYINNPEFIRNDAPEETLGVGAPPQVTFPGNLTYFPVWLQSLTITDGVEVFTDNGDGTLTGSAGGTGVINPVTGQYSVTFNTAPTAGTDILATYWYATLNTTTAKIYKGKVVDRVFA